MNSTKKMLLVLAALITAAVFSGCEEEGGDDDYTKVVLSINATERTDETIYFYDLDATDSPYSTTDESIRDADDWDIAVRRDRYIRTNSGVTRSGGSGGVAYAGTTDFSTTFTQSEVNALFNEEENPVDFTYYQYSDEEDTSSSDAVGNAICYPGYTTTADRDGTESKPWIFSTDVDFAAANCYVTGWDYMSPNYEDYATTGNVYIVKSGDGNDYYKLQIDSVSYADYNYSFVALVKKLEF